MPLQAVSAKEIHRRLELGEPDDVVARAVGRKERVIRYHRAWRCQCAVERPAPVVDSPPAAPVEAAAVAPAPVGVGDPDAVATAAYLAGLSPLAIAAALGIDAYSLDVDSPDFGLTGAGISRRRLERLAARADALERMRRYRPAQWAVWVAQQDDAERKAALDSRLPRETWTAFWADVVSHQENILIDGDFSVWMGWVKELVENRHTQMPKE